MVDVGIQFKLHKKDPKDGMLSINIKFTIFKSLSPYLMCDEESWNILVMILTMPTTTRMQCQYQSRAKSFNYDYLLGDLELPDN